MFWFENLVYRLLDFQVLQTVFSSLKKPEIQMNCLETPQLRRPGSHLLLAQLTNRLTKLLHRERSSIKRYCLTGK